MPKPRNPARITIVPTDHYVAGVPAIVYTGTPDDTVTSTDGVAYTLAELLAFRPPAFYAIGERVPELFIPPVDGEIIPVADIPTDPPAEPGPIEPEASDGTD